MQNQTFRRLEKKSDRRKLNRKIETLTNKSIELSTQHDCEILLIIYSEERKHWLQYCSSDSAHLFFGCQSAKEHLETIDYLDNTNYQKLFNGISSAENSVSPKPTKNLKRNETMSTFSQPIKNVEKSSDFMKSSMSTISTEYTLPKQESVFPPKINDPPKLTPDIFSLPVGNSKVENDSSSDFDFESYFVSYNK
jgi:hypothetical protein